MTADEDLMVTPEKNVLDANVGNVIDQTKNENYRKNDWREKMKRLIDDDHDHEDLFDRKRYYSVFFLQN
jgi:hypothetical protein